MAADVAGPRRNVLGAELVLGLARNGHIAELKFGLTEEPEAFVQWSARPPARDDHATD